MFMEAVRQRVRGTGARIVYPEGREERAIRAAANLRDQGLVEPMFLGATAEIAQLAGVLGIDLRGITLRDPSTDDELDAFGAAYYERRRTKGVTPDEARARATLPHYFGAHMVQVGAATGMVSGLNSATKPFLPAFEIVGLRDGVKR